MSTKSLCTKERKRIKSYFGLVRALVSYKHMSQQHASMVVPWRRISDAQILITWSWSETQLFWKSGSHTKETILMSPFQLSFFSKTKEVVNEGSGDFLWMRQCLSFPPILPLLSFLSRERFSQGQLCSQHTALPMDGPLPPRYRRAKI